MPTAQQLVESHTPAADKIAARTYRRARLEHPQWWENLKPEDLTDFPCRFEDLDSRAKAYARHAYGIVQDMVDDAVTDPENIARYLRDYDNDEAFAGFADDSGMTFLRNGKLSSPILIDIANTYLGGDIVPHDVMVKIYELVKADL